MAHEIEYRDGKHSFVENGKNGLAWHKLGVAYDRPLSAIEALEGCRADYNVGFRNIANLTQEQEDAIKAGNPVVIDPSQIIDCGRGVVREDNGHTLSVVKSRYEILQNKEAFEFVDYLTTGDLGKKATIDAAGVLYDGRKIFITAKFDDTVKIPGVVNDNIEMYLVFTNSFDGTSPVCCMTTPVRVVCNNTLNIAFKQNSGRINFRHTRMMKSRISLNEENMRHALSCLKVLEAYKEDLIKGIEILGNKNMNEEQIDNAIKFILCPEEQRKILINNKYDISGEDFSTRYRNRVNEFQFAMKSGIGQDVNNDGNALFFVNGVTTAIQNTVHFRSEESKFNSILGSNGNKLLDEAYNYAIAL